MSISKHTRFNWVKGSSQHAVLESSLPVMPTNRIVLLIGPNTVLYQCSECDMSSLKMKNALQIKNLRSAQQKSVT